MLQKLVQIDVCIPQSAPQGKSVDFIANGKDDHPAVGMPHLDMAAPTVNLSEAEAFQSCEHLPS